MFQGTASLWNRLTRKPASGTLAAALAEEDRRLWDRREVNVEIRATPATGQTESSLNARILDVSSGGVRIEVGRYFEPGDLLTLELPPRENTPSTSVLACVVYTQASEDERWVLGCRFSAELSDADLAAFGAAKQRPDLLDGRNWSRFPCQLKAIYQVVLDEDGPCREAKVLNISAGGVALVVDHDIRAGAPAQRGVARRRRKGGGDHAGVRGSRHRGVGGGARPRLQLHSGTQRRGPAIADVSAGGRSRHPSSSANSCAVTVPVAQSNINSRFIE